ncbi:MAG: hypothetical protein EBX95_05650 [Acidimicrobiia bacterium]|nr:hypothetical protein [Acidimicrobiia bacterium]
MFLSGFTADSAEGAVREARSIRPIHVNLCVSARFGGVSDEWSIAGDVASITRQLAETVDRHRPETIGVALVDRDPLPMMIDRAIEALLPLGR